MKQNSSNTRSIAQHQAVSVTYRVRIKPVLFSYHPSFILRSSFFRRSIILASRSGNNTETIRDDT